jgi:hypothetical protein
MKKPTVRKLKVAQETIRSLNTSELSQVGGGGDKKIMFDLTLSDAACDVYYKLFTQW